MDSVELTSACDLSSFSSLSGAADALFQCQWSKGSNLGEISLKCSKRETLTRCQFNVRVFGPC